MSRKIKGVNAERELIHLFHSKDGWGAVRAAGSGSMKYPCADILASNSQRYIAIECKASKEGKKYINKEEIDELAVFSKKFGAEPWLGIRFANTEWYFIHADNLKGNGKCFVILKKDIEKTGIGFEELVSMTKYDGVWDEKFKNYRY